MRLKARAQVSETSPLITLCKWVLGLTLAAPIGILVYEQIFEANFLLDLVLSHRAWASIGQHGSLLKLISFLLLSFKGWGFSVLLFCNAFCLGNLLLKLPFFYTVRIPLLSWPLGIASYGVAIFVLGSLLPLQSFLFTFVCFLPLLIRIVLLKRIPFSLDEIFPVQRVLKTPVLFLILIFCAMPIFILATSPPGDYDVLEYHLGAPMNYMQDGHIQFLPHNLYANMPSLSSMFYLVMILFKKGLAAKNVQALSIFLTSLTIVSMFPTRIGIVTACFFLLCPEWLLSCVTARNEPMIAFFGLWLFRVVTHPAARGRGLFAGILLGALFCLKYAAWVVFAPLVMGWLIINKDFSAVRGLVGGNLLVAGPWLVRNFLLSGNPLFPFFGNLFEGVVLQTVPIAESFSGRHFSADFSLSLFIDSISEIFTGYGSNWLGLTCICLSAMLLLQKSNLKSLSIFYFFFLGGLAMWFLGTHRVVRFTYLLLPLQMILIVTVWQSYNKIGKRLLGGLVLLHVGMSLILFSYLGLHHSVFALAVGAQSRDAFLSESYSTFEVSKLTRSDGQPFQRLLYVGEARNFYRSSDIIYATPYLHPPVSHYIQSSSIHIKKLKEDGIDGVYVNVSELERVQDKYPTPPAWSNRELIQMLERDLKLIWSGRQGFDRVYEIE